MKDYLNINYNFDSDNLTDALDELSVWSAPFGLKLLDNIRLRRNLRVLDIGFGTGFPLTELAMRLGKSAKLFGIDPWEAAIRRAEKKIAFYEIENIQLIRGVAENIPLGNESIDLITSNNGLNNVADINQSLKECRRILSKGGQFVQTMNLDETMIEFYDIFRSVLQQMKLFGEIGKMKAHIYEKRKPLDEYVALLETNGFTIENVIHDRFEYKFVDGTAMFNHYFIRLAFLNGWMEIVPEEHRKEVFAKIEMKINEKSETAGYFKLSIPFVLIDCTKKK